MKTTEQSEQSMMHTMVRIFSILLPAFILALPALAQDSRQVKKKVQCKPDIKVVVDTYKGSVDITGWEKNEVDIVATIESDGHNRYAREQVEDTEIRIDESASTIRIKTDYRRAERHRSFFGLFSGDDGTLPLVHYRISLPRTATVVVKDYKSDNTIEGVHAGIDINSYKGSIEIENANGSVALETYKGEATVKLRTLKNRCSFDTYKGEIRIKVPDSIAFDVDVDLDRSAELYSDFSFKTTSKSKKSKGYHFTEKINGGGPEIALKSYKGKIRLERY